MAKKNFIKTNKTNKMSIKEDADKIFSKDGKPNPTEILKLMRKSGLSYKQITGGSLGVFKSMNKEKEKAEKEGRYFDEKAYLDSLMNQATKN